MGRQTLDRSGIWRSLSSRRFSVAEEIQGDQQVETSAELATRLGIKFKNLALLSRALTHRSYLNEHPEALQDNERLEFLGDAVLDFLVGAWLYNHFPEMAEGDLTRWRSALVRTEQLAEFARQLNLGGALRLGRGEGLGGGRQSQTLLCGTFEALVGAVFLEQGMSAVASFVEPLLGPAADHIQLVHQDRDPKSQLQEIVQSHGATPPIYRTIGASGPEHDKTFEVEVEINGQVLGRGLGHSKRSAAKAAARAALEEIDRQIG
jgi:ribonuclease-3